MSIQEEIEKLEAVESKYALRSFVSDDTRDRIRIKYYFNQESGHVLASVRFGKEAQGPPGHAHGGAIASVLDETMGLASWMNKLMTMTAELKVTYVRAVPLETDFYVDAWVADINSRKIDIQSRLVSADGKEHSKGNGLFIKQEKERFRLMLEKSEKISQPNIPL